MFQWLPMTSNRIATTTQSELYDCVVVGAGPAGLTALEYLSRFHRRAVALGGGGPKPRISLVDRTYNLPGFPSGITGAALLARLAEQAQAMGGEISPAVAARIDGSDANFVVTTPSGERLHARKIILATGVHDREPNIPGIAPHVGNFIRYCPVCDGFEHTGKRLGIIGGGPSVARHALFLRTFSDQITIFLHGAALKDLAPCASLLRRRGIAVVAAKITNILEAEPTAEKPHVGCGLRLEDGTEYRLAVLYSALGCDVHLDPVRHLGLKLDSENYIVTDCRQLTSKPGIYAAGDIVSQVNQICVAFGQAAIAAVELHQELGTQET